MTVTKDEESVASTAGRRLTARLAGDVAVAFPDVIVIHQDGIYSGALRLTGNRHDAEDIAQETFIRAYRALLGYDPERIRSLALRPWLWTIALNLCRNAARSRKRQATTTPLTADDGALPSAVDVAAEGVETVVAAEWDQRLATLPAAMRDAVVLRHVVGLPYAEIGAALDRPVGTVKADVHRGLERLRRLLAAETKENP